MSHVADESGPLTPPQRIQGLDGLRALSITLVLVAHLIGTRGFYLPDWCLGLVHQFELGILGVRVFFVISGFLITSLLLSELERTGSVSLLRFYFRRTLRIFPPFYLYLAVIAAATVAGIVAFRDGDLLHAATYTMNYHRDRAWHLGHTWSLSVEEQFYLLWPALFRILGPRRALPALLGFLALAPAWRLAVGVWMPGQRLGIGETFFTTADSIAAGCILAMVRNRLCASSRYRTLVDSRWFYLLAPGILLANGLGRFAKLDWLVTATVQNIFIAVVIERLTRESGWMARALAWRPLVLLGLWSYSVYLWQQPFLHRNDQVSWWTAFPVNLLATLLFAAASYYAVERPTLRLRERMETRWLPKRAATAAAAS